MNCGKYFSPMWTWSSDRKTSRNCTMCGCRSSEWLTISASTYFDASLRLSTFIAKSLSVATSFTSFTVPKEPVPRLWTTAKRSILVERIASLALLVCFLPSWTDGMSCRGDLMLTGGFAVDYGDAKRHPGSINRRRPLV